MGKIIACIDGSAHTESVYKTAAWLANNTDLQISLLHVVSPHADLIKANSDNLSGYIGLGAKSSILEELTRIDEQRSKLEQKKGRIILNHAQKELTEMGISEISTLHRRGSLVETLTEIAQDVDIIVMGKRGENAEFAPDHLGANLEKVARALKAPILISPKNFIKPKNIMIAYDGSKNSDKAFDYITTNHALKQMPCHLVYVGKDLKLIEPAINKIKQKAKTEKIKIQIDCIQKEGIGNALLKYIKGNNIGIMLMGAYGHSRIRNFFIGSTTTYLIHNSSIPVLLFHC